MRSESAKDGYVKDLAVKRLSVSKNLGLCMFCLCVPMLECATDMQIHAGTKLMVKRERDVVTITM